MRGARHPRRVLPATAAAGLLVAALALAVSFLEAPRADAAAYYVGGGKGVRLAVRVVDHQIVWAKVRVREHCTGNGVVRRSFVNRYEGMAGPIPIGRNGSFHWKRENRVRNHFHEQVSVRNIVGKVGPRRLAGRLLYYLHFKSLKPPERGKFGTCWSGSGPRRPRHISVPITAHRRSEPPGLAFYFAAKKKGITAYFEVRGRRIVRAEVGAVHYCTGRHGRRFHEDLLSPFRSPIRIGPSGGFKADESSEYGPYEVLRGRVGTDRITGNYGFETGFDEGPRCRTGGFDASLGKGPAIHFVAPRR